MIVVQEGLDKICIRKLIELVLDAEDIQVKLLGPPVKGKKSVSEQRTVPVEDNARKSKTSNLVIKSEKGYKDLFFREVKTKVNIDDLRVDVKKLRRTNKGDLLMTVEGDGEYSRALKKAI